MRYNQPKTNVQNIELLNSLCGNSPKEPAPGGFPSEFDSEEGGA